MSNDEHPKLSEHDRILLEMFDRYRDYVKHQYDLIQHRTNWFIVIQSFLFAAYGFTIQKMLEVVARDLGDKPCSTNMRLCDALLSAERFSMLLGFVGVATGLATAAGIFAGRSPLRAIYQRSEGIRGALQDKGLSDLLPFSSGGFKSWPHQIGPLVAMVVAIALCIAWVALLAVNHRQSIVDVRTATPAKIETQDAPRSPSTPKQSKDP